MRGDEGKCSRYQGEPCPPRIGWKACENQFFLDGCRILEQTALRYWREGGAILWLSVITGPGFCRSQAMHCLTMRFDCRISSTRTR